MIEAVRLPGPRDEAWKYTPVRRLLDGLAEGPARIATRSTSDLPAYGSPPADADRDAWGFAALADRVGDGRARVGALAGALEADHRTEGSGIASVRHVWAAEGDAVLVERLTGGARALALQETTIRVPAGARVIHVRIADPDAGARHAGLVTVEVARDARYELVSFLAGGDVGRLDVAVRLAEPGATAELTGLTVLGAAHRGEEQHADHHVTVFHDAPRTTSRQSFRALVDGRARSVFTGKVVVRRGAEGSDAAQLHRALLLAERAVATARPQLEIHTDEVKASHGTAVGALDPEALFYLRQRGLDIAGARALLVHAFAAAVLDAVPAALRDGLAAQLAGWRSA